MIKIKNLVCTGLVLFILNLTTSDCFANNLKILEKNLGLISCKTKTVKTKFTIKNSENDEFRIIRSKGSCGCIWLDEKHQKIIKKGQSISLVVHLKMDGLYGNVRKSVSIEVEADSKKRIIKLIVFGRYESAWLEPDSITFGEISSKEQKSRTISLFSCGLTEPKLISFSCPNTNIKILQEPFQESQINKANNYKTVSVFSFRIATKELKLGKQNDLVTIRLQLKPGIEKDFLVPIRWCFVGNISVSPKRIFFGRVRDNSTIERSFIIDNKEGEFAMDNITFDTGSKVVKVEKIVKKSDEKLKFRVILKSPKESQQKGLNKGRIRVLNKGIEIGSLPFLFYVAAKS